MENNNISFIKKTQLLVKSNVLAMGESFMAVMVILFEVSIILAALGSLFTNGFLASLGILFVGSLFVILTSFFIYLMIDIRDKLTENNDLLKKTLIKD